MKMGADITTITSPFTASWFLYSRYLGSEEVNPLWVHEVKVAPPSIFRQCPVCGDVWSRIVVSPATRYLTVARKCPKHGMGCLGFYNDTENYPMPLEALKYEIQTLNPNGSAYAAYLITGGS